MRDAVYGENISGDAAEYLVAYTVTKKLGWPFRLASVDLGVDGEIEILDDQGRSQGDIIKVQIKGVKAVSGRGRNIYVTDEHIKYWKNFSAPIIMCCVDQKNEAIYWKSIYQSEPYASKGIARKLVFKTTDNRLDASSKSDFRMLVTPAKAKDISVRITKLVRYVELWGNSSAINGSDDSRLIALEKEVADIRALVSDLRADKLRFPWRFELFDHRAMDAALQTAQWVLNSVGQARSDWAY